MFVVLMMLSVFSGDFTGKTLRFDYFHTGISGEEHISLDEIRLEGDWPGSTTLLIDTTNYGKYLFQVIDMKTNQVKYSRGFASIYGEWETTGEAKKGIYRTFHESQRFPEPSFPFQLILKKRGTNGAFREIYTGVFDPNSRFINRSGIQPLGEVWAWLENGNPTEKLDLLIMAEGYTNAEKEKFRKDVDKVMTPFFNFEPYKTRKKEFNVWAVHVPAAESGVSNPRMGIWKDSPLGCSFNAFDSDRYVLTYKNKFMRDAAAAAPYDALIILVNTRKYGGGGIFNLYTTMAADSSTYAYLAVHEFGHSFAGLADEYYTSSVSYEDFNAPGVEPWEPNVTALLDSENIKWKAYVKKETPLPTPWEQSKYDEASYAYQKKRNKMRAEGADESAMEALFTEVKNVTKPMLEEQKYFGKVGAFEGAGYQAKGLYRPEADCIMFTRNPDSYCKVCLGAVNRIIDMYVR